MEPYGVDFNAGTLSPPEASTIAPLLVIVGETASGKSSLAMHLAEQFNGEIIAADSWTVYREFDIGTAKPITIEKQRIKHHLIDVVDARGGFNAALYKALACQAIANISASGKLPILVGGTGLYIDSVLYDFSFLPTASSLERSVRNVMTLEGLLAEAKKKSIDLSGIDTRNKRRIIRALETNGQRPTHTKIRPNTLIIGLRVEREKLREQVIKRVDDMISSGLEAEVRGLAQKYGWGVEPMKGIGYIEWQDYFTGSQTLPETKDRIINATMNLAKRQRTWFKRNNSTHWINDLNISVDLVTTFLNKKQ